MILSSFQTSIYQKSGWKSWFLNNIAKISDEMRRTWELNLIFKGICSNLETSIYVQNFCQIFDTWVLVKKNICGHLIAAQILEFFSDSVRELSESQLGSLVKREVSTWEGSEGSEECSDILWISSLCSLTRITMMKSSTWMTIRAYIKPSRGR